MYHMITSKHAHNIAQTISILYMPKIKHYQTLFPKPSKASKTLNGATVPKSNRNVSSDLEKKTNNDVQINDMNNEASYLQAEKFPMTTHIDMQKNTFTTHWSFLNDSEITKIINHLLGMKIDDLKALYDTINCKLAKRNGYVVDYKPILTAILGCHSHTLLLGSSEQVKLRLTILAHMWTKTRHHWENQ